MLSSDPRPAVPAFDADLLAFARGHSEAASSIHDAVLAALPAETPGEFAAIVTRDWPWLLAVDQVVFGWARHGRAIVAAGGAQRSIEAKLIARMADRPEEVSLRTVDRGHPLFGAQAGAIRSEALICLSAPGGSGLLVLGDRGAIAEETLTATRLLRFLGRAASAMLARWPLLEA
ncbi:hypothetical protein FHS31_000732 [Sphingomonas vulcanisoli]|uniref:DUF484 family protein n=1 Tax=Sphingomonas vulcanisoli TaxID=1658060 RepID=A0ABX0TTQ0_9SPHN|nr:DUF484 domain-containing protein [Sphingomonas vulcanisoli]NIJ07150.1 hypothetical protein [Sphingomonas vulcanisoli]